MVTRAPLWAAPLCRGTSKGNTAFPQGHGESLAGGRTYLRSWRNILKLSGLGTRPWFALSFHRLIEFVDLNFSEFSQSVLFASSGALQSYARPPGLRVRILGGAGAMLAPWPSEDLQGEEFWETEAEHGPWAGHWEGAPAGWEDKPSPQRAEGLGYRNQPGGQYRVNPLSIQVIDFYKLPIANLNNSKLIFL